MTATLEQRLAAGLLAEHAGTATRPGGPCAVCQRAILRGERYALTVTSGRLAHLPCIGRMVLRPQPLTRIRVRTRITG